MNDVINVVDSVRTDDSQVAAMIQQLIDWHAEKVATLQQVLDIPPEKTIRLVMDGETIQATPEMMVVLKMGIEIALAQFGRLPISISRNDDDDEGNDDE